jgi:hypothetical protein
MDFDLSIALIALAVFIGLAAGMAAGAWLIDKAASVAARAAVAEIVCKAWGDEASRGAGTVRSGLRAAGPTRGKSPSGDLISARKEEERPNAQSVPAKRGRDNVRSATTREEETHGRR